MQIISTDTAPAPAGHYSQAVVSNGLLFVSGLLPGPLQDGEAEGFDRQVVATLKHCSNVLAAAGCRWDQVVQCTAYIVGIDHWRRFDALFAAALATHRPARAVVPVPELHHGFLIELQLVAEVTPYRKP